jgi:hypothetical protein
MNPAIKRNVKLDHKHWDVPLRVPLTAYLEFNRNMGIQLRRLEKSWSHAATPWAQGIRVIHGQPKTLTPPNL